MRFVIVGNGKMAIDILMILAKTADAEVVLCIGDPSKESPLSRLKDYCDATGIKYFATRDINDPDCIAELTAVAADYLVSVNNFLIFRAPALAMSRYGIVNFHNGPLPRYGGVNACSWAILKGELEYGVTWHLVDGGIDSGPILLQKKFPLTSDETAIELVSRCIREGLGLFETLAPQLVSGDINAFAQKAEDRSYFSAKDRAFGGWFPWWESLETLRRLCRALDFHPVPNAFYRPRFAVNGKDPLYVETARLVSETTNFSPGIVLDANEDGVVISVSGGAILLGPLFDAEGNELSNVQQLKKFSIARGIQLMQGG